MIYNYWKAKLSKEECEKLIEEFDISSADEAEVGIILNTPAGAHQETKKYYPDHSIRKTKINWVPRSHIYNKILGDYILKTNEILFHYDLTKYSSCQFARYNVGDYYHFHQDAGALPEDFEKETRKLSMTVQLSDPDSYEGGQFYFYNGMLKEDEPPIQEQGSILVFDSKMWHRVSPVTKGVRYSLVSWSSGPPFK